MSILSNELQLPAYVGLTDQECLDALQAKNIEVKQTINTKDILKYLAVVGKLMPLEASATDSAKEATRILNLFETLEFTDINVENKLIAVLDALITDALIDATDKTYVLSLGSKMVSRAEELGIGNVSLWEIEKARV